MQTALASHSRQLHAASYTAQLRTPLPLTSLHPDTHMHTPLSCHSQQGPLHIAMPWVASSIMLSGHSKTLL